MNVEKREFIARNVMALLRPGDLVNLGAGIPSHVANYMKADSPIMVQTECGTIGGGPLAEPDKIDYTLIDPATRPSTLLYDGICFDSTMSFTMIRGGHLDVTVLGAMEVDEEGNMANWEIPGEALKGMGGAMDLCVGAKRVIIAMEHCTKTGEPKIRKKCVLPLTCKGEVDCIVTELAIIDVTPEGLLLRALAPGITAAHVRDRTEPELIVKDEPAVMTE
jgi:3-oxoacid CoA-transferase B subunit